MNNNLKYGFTLVELIVVITILAVLATIGFISMTGYSRDSRDSVRLADLKTLESGLNIYSTKNTFYPTPGNPLSVETYGLQGEMTSEVSGKLGISDVKDPQTGEYYIYRTNSSNTKYQLLGFLEQEQTSLFAQYSFANNIHPISKGNKLGIILNPDGKTLPTSIDLSLGTYNIVFSNNSEENLNNVSGIDNFIVLKSSDKGLYDESLVGYWDMETLTSDGKLADLSGNNNHGTIHDDNGSGFATPVNGALIFDGVDDYIQIANNDELDGFNGFTFIYKIDLNDSGTEHFLLNKMLHYSNQYTDDSYGWRIRSDGTTFIQVSNNSGNNVSSTFEKQEINGVYILRYNQKEVELIVNNKKIPSINNNFLSGVINTTPEDIIIGRSNPNPNNAFLNGVIDEIMIFNRALSQGEIDKIYKKIQ